MTAGKDVTISARVGSKLAADVSKLARAMGRSKSWVINTALESYVGNEREFVAAVEKGLADLRGGRVYSHESVVARAAARRRKRAR